MDRLQSQAWSMGACRVTAFWGLVCWLTCSVRAEIGAHVERPWNRGLKSGCEEQPELWGPRCAQAWRSGLAALFLGWGHSSVLWEGRSSVCLLARSVSAVAVELPQWQKLAVSSAERAVGVHTNKHCRVFCCECGRHSAAVLRALEVLGGKDCWTPLHIGPLETTVAPLHGLY